MKSTNKLFLFVVLLVSGLVAIPDMALGQARIWFQTNQLSIAERKGAGILHIPPTGTETAGTVLVWTPAHVLAFSAGTASEFMFGGNAIVSNVHVSDEFFRRQSGGGFLDNLLETAAQLGKGIHGDPGESGLIVITTFSGT